MVSQVQELNYIVVDKMVMGRLDIEKVPDERLVYNKYWNAVKSTIEQCLLKNWAYHPRIVLQARPNSADRFQYHSWEGRGSGDSRYVLMCT